MIKATELKIRREKLSDLANASRFERSYTDYLTEIARMELHLTTFVIVAQNRYFNYAYLKINDLIDKNEELSLHYRQKVKDWRLVRDVGALYEARLKSAKDKIWETSPAEVAA